MAVYHRFDDSDVIDEIKRRGELWGGPPQGFLASDMPKVKAFSGPLPNGKNRASDGRLGYEFTTDAVPDSGGVPGWPTWSGNRNGVKTVGDRAAIKAVIL